MSRDPILGMFASQRRQDLALGTLKLERTYKQTKLLLDEDQLFDIRRRVCGDQISRAWDLVYTYPKVPKSKDWVQELGWIAHSFVAHADLINRFLSLSQKYWGHFMLGEFDRASAIIQEVEHTTGYSFWLAEHQFMLYQAREGFDDHKAHLARIQSTVSDPVVGYLVTMLSNRLEPHVTPDAYNKNIQTALAEVTRTGHTRLAGLLELQLSIWTFDWTNQVQDMLHLCCSRVLVDRYLFVRKILVSLNPGELKESQSKQLQTILGDIRSVVNDPAIDRIAETLLGKDGNAKPAPEAAYLSALDNFWAGDFDSAVKQSEALVENHPTVFCYYWLLARSLACSSSEHTSRLDAKCPASRILRALQGVAENHVQIEVLLIELNAVAFKLGACALGINTWQFSERELTGKISDIALRYAQLLCDVFDVEEGRNGNLGDINASEHPSVSLINYRQRPTSYEGQLPSTTAPEFAAIIQAERARTEGAFERVLALIQPVLDDDFPRPRSKTFLSGEIARLQFAAEVGLNRPENAALSVVENFVKNRNALRHVYFEELIVGGRNGRWPSLSKTPYFPILVWLNQGDEQDVYEAVDDLISALHLHGPRDLLPLAESLNLPVARILLRDVLTAPVLMRGPLWASTPAEQRQIRTEILRKLFSISIDDQAFVVDELAQVERDRLLEEAYRDVEGPKFSLDFSDHNRTLAGYLQGAFERYSAYRAYEEKGGQLTGESELLEQATTGITRTGSDKKPETSEVLLSNLSLTVFVEYIWNSRKGVNATLSTRIRHGSLENQLKRIFGARHLLAIKDLTNNYQCDKVVMNVLETCEPEARAIVENAFIGFTTELNGIYDRLLTKLKFYVPPGIMSVLQQLGAGNELASEDGILDVSVLFSQATLDRLKAANPKSTAGLLTELESIFSESLVSALEKVRNFVRMDAAKEILTAIDKLDVSVATTLPDGWERAHLRNDILAAKNEIVADLRIIEKWFSLADRSETSINSIKRLFATAGRVVQFASNEKLGVITDSIAQDYEVGAEEGVVLYEVLSILLRNVVQHSGVVATNQRVRYAYTVRSDGTRSMTISNLVKDSNYCVRAVQLAIERLNAPRDLRVLDRSPGGTGLRRIQELLKQISGRPIAVLPSVGDDTQEFRIQIEF